MSNRKIIVAPWCAVLMVLFLSKSPAQAAGLPLVISATVNYTNKTLTISGQNFGSSPSVTLDSMTFPTMSSSSNQIVADFPNSTPPSSFAPGTYFLAMQFKNQAPAIFTVDIGTNGPQGATGTPGPTGPAGLAGAVGPQGATGSAGPSGPQGVAGPAGAQGTAGVSGPAGPAGAAGPAGPAGTAGPAGAEGAAGAPGANGTNGVGFTFIGPWQSGLSYATNDAVSDSNGSSYVALQSFPNSITDPASDGAHWALMAAGGAQGLQGNPGATGQTGATGPAGPVGPQGLVGPIGPVGATGAAGAAGAAGPAGSTGATGPQGPQGLAGGNGTNGTNGTGVPSCATSDSVVSYQGALACKSTLPHYVDNGDGTVTDNMTGLMWEKKSIAGTGDVHDVNNSYTWNDPTIDSIFGPSGTLYSIFLQQLNGLTLSSVPLPCFAGHCDWRIPDIGELRSILSVSYPTCESVPSCIDPIFTPNQSAGYWSSSSLAGQPSGAWVSSFSNGGVFGEGKNEVFYARAVRSGR